MHMQSVFTADVTIHKQRLMKGICDDITTISAGTIQKIWALVPFRRFNFDDVNKHVSSPAADYKKIMTL